MGLGLKVETRVADLGTNQSRVVLVVIVQQQSCSPSRMERMESRRVHRL